MQLYACSGQLATGETLHKRGKLREDSCRYGCNAIEDMHHLFIKCKHYDDWRTGAVERVTEGTEERLSKTDIEENVKDTLLSIAKSSFKNNDGWPLHYFFLI